MIAKLLLEILGRADLGKLQAPPANTALADALSGLAGAEDSARSMAERQGQRPMVMAVRSSWSGEGSIGDPEANVKSAIKGAG